MSFQLVYGDHELVLPLCFDLHIEDRLINLLGRREPNSFSVVERELSVRIVDAITAVIENSVGPPTEKQLKYAIGIARELNLQLSADVLQSRDAMAAFLSQHAEEYRRRKSNAAYERK